MPKNNTPQEIWDAIMASKNPICCIDSRFDFDAFGSALALKEVMKEHVKDLALTFDGQIPDKAKEMLDVSSVKTEMPPSEVDFSNYDLLIFLDSGNLEHISKTDNFSVPEGLKTVNIDHHAGNPFYGDLNYVIGGACSTCSVLYDILIALSLKINEKTAKYLLTGHVTDSGFFQYSCVKSDDLRKAAYLMDFGASFFDISWHLNFAETEDDYRYRTIVYKNLKVVKGKGYAYSTVLSSELNELKVDLNKVGAKASNLIDKLEGVDFVFVVKDSLLDDGSKAYNVSFRSHNPDFSVLPLAVALDGGGHKMAA